MQAVLHWKIWKSLKLLISLFHGFFPQVQERFVRNWEKNINGNIYARNATYNEMGTLVEFLFNFDVDLSEIEKSIRAKPALMEIISNNTDLSFQLAPIIVDETFSKLITNMDEIHANIMPKKLVLITTTQKSWLTYSDIVFEMTKDSLQS